MASKIFFSHQRVYFWISAFDHRAIILDKMHIVQWKGLKIKPHSKSKIENRIHQHQRQQHPPLSFSFWAEVAKTVSSRTYSLLLISCLSEQLQALFSLLRRWICTVERLAMFGCGIRSFVHGAASPTCLAELIQSNVLDALDLVPRGWGGCTG